MSPTQEAAPAPMPPPAYTQSSTNKTPQPQLQEVNLQSCLQHRRLLLLLCHLLHTLSLRNKQQQLLISREDKRNLKEKLQSWQGGKKN